MDDSINMTHPAHSECVNGVEIVAEETTPRHLSGGDGERRRRAEYVCRGKLCRSCRHRQKSLLTAWWTSHRNQPLQIHIVTHLKSKKMRESDHLILITCGKIWAKATHIWLVSMSGDNAANTAKVQGYALCLPTKRTGLPRTSPIMLLPCHEIAEARRLPPPHI